MKMPGLTIALSHTLHSLVLSPLISYSDQIYSIHRSKNSAGFSLDIPLIMLVASIFKYVLSRPFEPPRTPTSPHAAAAVIANGGLWGNHSGCSTGSAPTTPTRSSCRRSSPFLCRSSYLRSHWRTGPRPECVLGLSTCPSLATSLVPDSHGPTASGSGVPRARTSCPSSLVLPLSFALHCCNRCSLRWQRMSPS